MTLMEAIHWKYDDEHRIIGREFMKRIEANGKAHRQGRKFKPASRYLNKAEAKLNKKYRYLCEYVGVDWAEFKRIREAYVDSFIP